MEQNNYAIIRHGGKQYKVSQGSIIKIDKVSAKPGEQVKFDDVIALFKNNTLEKSGSKSAEVTAKVLADVKDKKLIIYKKKRTKGYSKKQGHRQLKSQVLIESIN